MDENKKRKYHKLLLNYRDYYGVYHHHKEMMAWLATALYISGSTYLFFKKGDIMNFKCLAAIAVILITAITIAFIRWQFCMRTFAARIVSACTTLLTCSINGCDLKEENLQPDTFIKCNKDSWPKILVETAQKDQQRLTISEVLTYIMIAIFFLSLLIWFLI